ncbi:MAG: NERD domain-containing protein [Chloroflexi bacterium]|nr:NERD domain-containing protein [Chloroflexota bacterium]
MNLITLAFVFLIIFVGLIGFLVLVLLFLNKIFPSRRIYARVFPSNGNIGEAQVLRKIIRHFNTPNYHLLNNITIPFGDGTTQIDHILISTKGVFVIETKDYSGWLFAEERSPHWTQVIYRMKHKFPNPLRQNYRHIKAIQKLLDFIPKEHIHSVVVFTGSAEFKTEIPKNVFYLDQLANHINTFQEDVITTNRMQFCVGRIECTRYQISRKTDVEHQEFLNRKFGSV